jgi:hypothetical protein
MCSITHNQALFNQFVEIGVKDGRAAAPRELPGIDEE